MKARAANGSTAAIVGEAILEDDAELQVREDRVVSWVDSSSSGKPDQQSGNGMGNGNGSSRFQSAEHETGYLKSKLWWVLTRQ